MRLGFPGRFLARRLQRRGGCCALIAIKQRVRAKSRLAGQLNVAARVELVRAMLDQVLAAALAARTLGQVMVLSPERDAVPAEIPVLADDGTGLNQALGQARRTLLGFGVHELLVLSADLPQLRPSEIDALVRAARGGGLSIAPDAVGTGTNALCLAGAEPFQFRFGAGSRHAHRLEGERFGLKPRIVRLPGLEFDIDTPADLRRLQERPWPAQLRG